MNKNSWSFTKNSVTTVVFSLLVNAVLNGALALGTSLYFYSPESGYRDSYFEPVLFGLTPDFLIFGPLSWLAHFVNGFFCAHISKSESWLINTALFTLTIIFINLGMLLIDSGGFPDFSIYSFILYLSIFVGAYARKGLRVKK